ncbi:hypothetical protein NDU88_003659 [Pleurodeles waltl]|uniref:Uncharacterized protein n=1 Tax=Pleurodeles waltl TaxID=8319 RepID=A0AAV7SGM0_PLEWA|nr:hypothetical protein NDU88_003659 [Pleurodeles waltl]
MADARKTGFTNDVPDKVYLAQLAARTGRRKKGGSTRSQEKSRDPEVEIVGAGRRTKGRATEDDGRRTKKIRKMPGLLFKRADRSRNQDPCGPDAEMRTAGPGEHTSEPATLQEKRGQTRMFFV